MYGLTVWCVEGTVVQHVRGGSEGRGRGTRSMSFY